MRYSDTELDLMKTMFSDNDELLNALRKVFLQMPLTPGDKQWIENIQGKPAVLALVRKQFLPTLDPNAPRHQLMDMWMTLKLEDKTPMQAWPEIKARELIIEYMVLQLDFLEGNGKGANDGFIKFEVSSKPDAEQETYSRLLARNLFISLTELHLGQFSILAGAKTESVAQTKERLAKDSNR